MEKRAETRYLYKDDDEICQEINKFMKLKREFENKFTFLKVEIAIKLR